MFKVSFTINYLGLTSIMQIEVKDPSDDEEINIVLHEKIKSTLSRFYPIEGVSMDKVEIKCNNNFSKINK